MLGKLGNLIFRPNLLNFNPPHHEIDEFGGLSSFRPFIRVCVKYFILIQAPQGGVKKEKEGRNINIIIISIDYYYIPTHVYEIIILT